MNHQCLNRGRKVLRHCTIFTCEAEAQAMTTDATIKKVLNAVPVS